MVDTPIGADVLSSIRQHLNCALEQADEAQLTLLAALITEALEAVDSAN